MRKLIVVGVLAVLGPALIAVPASASFDHHFESSKKRSASIPTAKRVPVQGHAL